MKAIAIRPVSSFGELLPNCCKITEQGLLWKGEATTKQLREIGTQLKRFERGNSWWWGDYLEKIISLHIEEQKLEHAKQGTLFDLGPESINRHSIRYVGEYASSSGLDPQTLWTRRMVAAFYPIAKRTAKLSFEHYREAKSAGDLGKALDWLQKAEVGHMTVADLRTVMRKGSALGKDGTPPRNDGYGEEFADIIHWSSKKLTELASCSPHEAHELLRHLAPNVALIDHLRQRAVDGLVGSGGTEPRGVISRKS